MAAYPLRRNKLLRTPEGAWYNGYAGLRPPNAFDYYGYLGPPPAAAYGPDAVPLYGASTIDLPPPAAAADPTSCRNDMANYYDSRRSPSFRSKDGGRIDDDAARHLPPDLKLYDPYSRGNNNYNGGHDKGTARLDLSKPGYYGDTSPRNNSRNGWGMDFSGAGGKSYEPYPHNGPALHYGSSPPRDGGGVGGGGGGGGGGFGDATGMKQSYESPRLGHAGPGISPRRMQYEPSFHDPGASPRNNNGPLALQPWERERIQSRSPVLFYGDGQEDLEDPRAGKGSLVMHKQPSSIHAGSVFLFVRFHVDCQAVIGQACQAALVKDLKGEFVGIADKVYDFGDQPGKNRSGYAVFQFPSLKSAEVFYNRDRNFRQPDFPRPFGDIDIFAIELQTDPIAVKAFKAFLLSEVTINDGLGPYSLDVYERSFKAPFTKELVRLGALPYVAFSDHSSRRTLKRRYFDRKDLVTLHMFRNLDHYRQVWESPEYSRLRDDHRGLATEKCSLFMVRPEYT